MIHTEERKEFEVKHKECSQCKTKIEVKNYFEQGDNIDNSFVGACKSCKNNRFDDDEYPCLFCSEL